MPEPAEAPVQAPARTLAGSKRSPSRLRFASSITGIHRDPFSHARKALEWFGLPDQREPRPACRVSSDVQAATGVASSLISAGGPASVHDKRPGCSRSATREVAPATTSDLILPNRLPEDLRFQGFDLNDPREPPCSPLQRGSSKTASTASRATGSVPSLIMAISYSLSAIPTGMGPQGGDHPAPADIHRPATSVPGNVPG
jgi:hypothetical protein